MTAAQQMEKIQSIADHAQTQSPSRKREKEEFKSEYKIHQSKMTEIRMQKDSFMSNYHKGSTHDAYGTMVYNTSEITSGNKFEAVTS